MATHGYFKIWKALKGYPCLFSWLQSSLCWRRWWFWWRWCWWFWCRRKLLDPRSTVNCGGSLPQVGVAMFTFLNEAMFFTMQCFPILNDVIFRRCLKNVLLTYNSPPRCHGLNNKVIMTFFSTALGWWWSDPIKLVWVFLTVLYETQMVQDDTVWFLDVPRCSQMFLDVPRCS